MVHIKKEILKKKPLCSCQEWVRPVDLGGAWGIASTGHRSEFLMWLPGWLEGP